ncbi:MAG: GAK system ATP-grasp enzyme [Candidatus Omnitrophota bacterium]
MVLHKPRVGVIGVEEKWSCARLADAFAERTGFRLLVDLTDVSLDTGTGVILCGDVDIGELDALVIKKIGPVYSPEILDRLNLLRYLERGGLPVFSSPRSIAGMVNRLHCTTELLLAGIPLPETVITEKISIAADAVRRYRKAVLKPLYTSKARGMVVVADSPSLEDSISRYQQDGNPVIYVQKFLKHSGRDLGLVFLGGRYLGAYARVQGSESWNTTTASGGKYEAAQVPDDLVGLAHRAQECMDLDYTSVDLVETAEGPKIFEVSAFGGFKGLWETQRIDAAGLYADYVLERITV